MQQITLDQFPLDSFGSHPFEVDRKGDCITTVKIKGSNGTRTILYKTEGGMYEFPKSDGVFDYFVGYNGNLYCCSLLNEDWQNKQYKYYL